MIADLIEIVRVPVFCEAAGGAGSQFAHEDIEANGLGGSDICSALGEANFKAADPSEQNPVGSRGNAGHGVFRRHSCIPPPRIAVQLNATHSQSLPATMPHYGSATTGT